MSGNVDRCWLHYLGWLSACLLVGALAGQPFQADDPSGPSLAQASLAHPLGTDLFGRDQAVLLGFATWNSACRATFVTLLSMAVGYALALVAALRPGSWVDAVLAAAAEFLRAFPSLVAVLLLSAMGVPSYLVATAYFAANAWRIVRQQFGQELERPYALALELAGLGRPRLLAVELARVVMPRLTPVALVMAAESLAIVEALAFLGIAQTDDSPSLGSLLREAYSAGLASPLLWAPSIAALMLLPVSVQFLAQLIQRRADQPYKRSSAHGGHGS
jgi:ABC-type dipeptide/oligopeptide/nickel transport system permease subunit